MGEYGGAEGDICTGGQAPERGNGVKCIWSERKKKKSERSELNMGLERFPVLEPGPKLVIW